MSYKNAEQSDSTYIGYIYCIECIIDNKKYVGQTTSTIEKRYEQHISCANSGIDTYLYRAIRLHGKGKFKVYQLEVVTAGSSYELSDLLNELEKSHIETLDTYAPRGYNMTHGGREFSTPSSRPVCMVNHEGDVLNSFESIREAAKSTGRNEKNIQDACNSKSHYSGGMFWFYSSGDITVGLNIGRQEKGKNNWKGHTTYSGLPVNMYSKGGVLLARYNSSADASRVTGVAQMNISRCCNGKRMSAGGYLWAYA